MRKLNHYTVWFLYSVYSVSISSIMTAKLFSDEDVSVATAHALVPSQIRGVTRRPLHVGASSESPTKIGSSGRPDEADDSGGDEVVYAAAATTSSVGVGRMPGSRRRKKKDGRATRKKSLLRTGNLPDVHWRSIPMSHLRLHPNFVPLPPPSQIQELPTKEHVRYFRQDSWQWDFLHQVGMSLFAI